VFYFENKIFSFEMQQARVSGQMSLRIIAELLKNMPVLLTRLRKPRLWWEQYLPKQGYDTDSVRFFYPRAGLYHFCLDRTDIHI